MCVCAHAHVYQFSSVAQSCPTLQDPMTCSSADFPITNSRSLLKLMSVESVMPSNHLILSSPSSFAFDLFSIRFFSRLNLDKFQVKSRNIFFTIPHMAYFLNSSSYNDHSPNEIYVAKIFFPNCGTKN